MFFPAPAQPSRAFPMRLAIGLPVALMLLLLVWNPHPLDLAIAQLFYTPGTGFIGKHSFWLEDILHDRAKQVVIGLGISIITSFLFSLIYTPWRAYRRTLGYLVLALGIATSLVTPLKKLTGIQCPWSLQAFGGDQVFSPLIGERPATEKPGRCWPGGHASAGFSLIALFFALRDRHLHAARIALTVGLGLGSIFSLGRMAQGAHFLSHNLWTLLLDWTICLLLYRLILYRPTHPSSNG